MKLKLHYVHIIYRLFNNIIDPKAQYGPAANHNCRMTVEIRPYCAIAVAAIVLFELSNTL